MTKILFILLCISGLSSRAQNSDKTALIGFKLGPNFANLSGDNLLNKESRFAYHFGMTSQLELTNKTHLAIDVLFSSQGVKQGSEIETRLNYIMLPVLLRYYANKVFYFEAGPQAGFLIAGRQSSSASNDRDVTGIKSRDLSINFGMGFKSESGFLIGARYNLGLSNINDIEFLDAKNYNRVLMLSIGYLFKN